MPYYLQTDEGDEYEFDDSIPEEEAVSWLDEALDVGRMIGQNMGASVVAGATGIGSLLWNQDVGQAVEDMNAVQEKLGYQPQTLEGQAIAAGLGAAGEAWEAPLNAAGEWVTDTTGSPLLGTIARTAPEALLGGSMKRAIDAPKYKTGMTPDPKTPLGRQKGIFLPEGARGFEKKLIPILERWEAQGADPRYILDQTGYFRGLEGEWLKYIPNKSFMEGTSKIDEAFQNTAFIESGKNIEGKLGDFLPKDDPIRQAYGSQVNNVKVTVQYYPDQKGSSGHFGPDGILIRAKDPETAKLTLIHEAQHVIQNVKKNKQWGAKGSNSQNFYDAYTKADDLLNKNLVRKMAVVAKYDWDRKIPAKINLQNIYNKLANKGYRADSTELRYLNKELANMAKVMDKRNRWRRYETEYGEAMARLSETWAKGKPETGMPFDTENLTKATGQTYRNSGLKWDRTTTPEDIHFDKSDPGVWKQRKDIRAVRESLGKEDPDDFMILPEDFGGLTD